MLKRRHYLAIVAVVLIAAGCAPPGSAPAGGQPTSPAAPLTGPKALGVALQGEPQVLITSLGLGNQPNVGGDVQGAVHQKLATLDDRGELHAQLAALPSQDNGDWVVRPDGTMQTTYRLRNDVTWHDGTPLTANDFIFAHTVTTDPELPVSQGKVAIYIDRLDAPDDHTLVVHWSKTYPFANGIVEDDLGPLPDHLIAEVHQTDKERFQQLPFWTTGFVGVGPYQMDEWVLGSHMTVKAYDRFYGGRAKIDTITFRFVQNAPTVVANLMAGALDGAIPAAMDFQQAFLVKTEWESAGKKPTAVLQSVHWRTMAFQFRPEVATPRDILDVRVRRALLHAIDRQSIVDTLFNGLGPISESFMPPDDFRWAWVQDAIQTYPNDGRRTHALLTEAGWQRTSDGGWTTASGQPANMIEWTTAGYEPEVAIIADNWKSVGIPTDQIVLSPGEARDRQYVSQFPGVMTTTFPINFQYWIQRHHGDGCPSEATRWVGNNRGCYVNAEHDRVADALNVALNPGDQQPLYRDLARIESEDVPALPLYFNIQMTVFREGVTGVKPNTKPKTTATWNVAEWDIQG